MFQKPQIQSKILVSQHNQSSYANLFGLGFLIFLFLTAPLLNLFYSSVPVHAESLAYEWAKGVGGTGDDFVYSLATDSEGSVYATGYFAGTMDFDPGAGISNLVSAGSDDGFILKLDSDGNFVWVKQFGGTGGESGNGITIDSNDNILAVGKFSNTVDFDPGVGTSNLVSVGSYDIFVLKLDSDGNFTWAKSIGGTSFDNGDAVTIDGADNVYVSGGFRNTADFDTGVGTNNLVSAGDSDIFVLKLQADGTYVWAKKMGGTGTDSGNSVTIDSLDNIYTTGSFNGTADFDPGVGTSNLISAGAADAFVSKLDSSGNYTFAKQIGGATVDNGNSISLDSDENIYITGQFTGTADFDPGIGTSNLTSFGSLDGYILKLDSSGNFTFVKRVGGTGWDQPFKIVIDGDNNLYFAGYYDGTADFDPGVGTFNITESGDSGNGDFFIVSLDSSGTFIWAKSMGGEDYEYGYALALDDDNNVLGAGGFSDVADFDPGSGTANLTSAGNWDIFIVKLAPVSNPVVAAPTSSLINTSGAILSSNITSTGGENAIERGFQYGLTDSYGSELSESSSYSTGSYSLELTGLACGTTYYFRAYAENSGGTGISTGSTFATTQCASSGSSGGGSSSGNNPDEIPIEYCSGQTNPAACSGIGIDLPATPNIPTVPVVSTVDTFLRNLGYGSVGEDVRKLQQFLNRNNFILATTGHGSPGHETTYYGPRTTRAITRFQEYYKDQILTPLNLKKGTGFFGKKTRSLINSMVR